MAKNAELMLEVQSQNAYLTNKENAIKYFEAQQNAIKAIKDTTWLQEIRKYWMMVWDNAVSRFETMDPKDVSDYKVVQAEAKIAKQFINFLSNILAE